MKLYINSEILRRTATSGLANKKLKNLLANCYRVSIKNFIWKFPKAMNRELGLLTINNLEGMFYIRWEVVPIIINKEILSCFSWKVRRYSKITGVIY